jgi:hypothetical protein
MLPRAPAVTRAPKASQMRLWTEQMKLEQQEETRLAQEATVQGRLDEYEAMLMELQKEHHATIQTQANEYQKMSLDRDGWQAAASELQQSVAKERQLNKQHADKLVAREHTFAHAMEKRDSDHQCALQQQSIEYSSREEELTGEINALQEQARMNNLEAAEIDREYHDFERAMKERDSMHKISLQQATAQVIALEEQVKLQTTEVAKAARECKESIQAKEEEFGHSMEQLDADHTCELQSTRSAFAEKIEALKQGNSKLAKKLHEEHSSEMRAKIAELQKQHEDAIQQLAAKVASKLETTEKELANEVQRKSDAFGKAMKEQERMHASIVTNILATSAAEQEHAERSSIYVPKPWEGIVKHLGGKACQALMARL